jgi:hypothetical protein
MLIHELKAVVHYLIENNSDANQKETDQDSKNHFIRFSLLDALLPNIVL